MFSRIFSLITLSAVALCAVAKAPKYVFYFIGDGMGMGQVMNAEAYNRDVLGNKDHLLMMQFPVVSVATNYSASNPITDSAAAGTALASGSKTKNGMLGMNADTVAVTSIATKLQDAGYGIGIVTTVPPDDATPGAFYAHVPKRSMYYEIGCDAAKSGFDFIAGSKIRGTFDSKGQPTDLLDQYARNGVQIAYGLEQLPSLTSRRVALVHKDGDKAPSQVGFTIDSVPGALTLPAMTQACLDHLQKNGNKRFFMMVEGGNIDYAGHTNDGGAAVKEVLNFNQALKIAYDFYKAHPKETLIVVTADHETGGLGLGATAQGYKQNLKAYDSQRISKTEFGEMCKKMKQSRRNYEWDDMKEVLGEKLGFWKAVPVSAEQEAMLKQEFENSFKSQTADIQTLYASFNNFTNKVFNVLDNYVGIGWTTYGHTGGLVPVYAIGVGAEKFNGFQDNTDLPAKILKITGVKK